MEIIFATQNEHKVDEVKAMLLGTDITIKSLKTLDCQLEVEETGDSFEANAFLKAKAIYDLYKIPVFSEDSGLVVDALNGLPGIHSARYAGEERNHDQNIDKLLTALKDVDKRLARFVSNICFYNGSVARHFSGKVEGKISYSRQGKGGFGYDPVFIPQDHNKSFAELGDIVKNKISHRKAAMDSFCSFLKQSEL